MKKYNLNLNKGNERYHITVPKVLVEALSYEKGKGFHWKLHPDGKSLILEPSTE